ncbi:MAG: helix-turn-helix transcriptional regulator [Actinomycetota bacterium]
MAKKSTPTPLPVRRALSDVGRHLADWRRLQGPTEEQVADRAGITRFTLRRIERGYSATFENVLRVARALGVVGSVVAAFDPMQTDVGRARPLESLPRRAPGRREMRG